MQLKLEDINIMKKSLSFILAAVASLSLMVSAATNEIVPKAPAMSASLKPCVAMYKQGNYVGAMQDLETLLEKEKNNTYAKYYLALSYTQLGYKEEAQKLYKEIAEKKDGSVLVYYSQRALDCIGNPESEQCNPPKKEEEGSEEEKPQVDDIQKFIQSGRQFHPSVTDRITKERMERQIQKEEYQKKQMENRSSYAMPTNEEIAAALNTLSKIGMNPYSQNNLQNAMMLNPMNMNNNNMYGALMNNANPDIAKMFLYSQQNSLMNYGI